MFGCYQSSSGRRRRGCEERYQALKEKIRPWAGSHSEAFEKAPTSTAEQAVLAEEIDRQKGRPMDKIIVALYDDFGDAQQAVHELEAAGFRQEDISVVANAADQRYLVTVKTSEADVDRAVAILERYGPVDVDQRRADWLATGWQRFDDTSEAYPSAAQAGEQASTGRPAARESEAAIPIVEEEQVMLREEHGNVNADIHQGKAVPSWEKHISVWISECSEGSKQTLQVGQAYTLNFKIGQPVLSSLVSGPSTEVPSADIPETGLATEWVIISQSVELKPRSPGTSTTSAILEGSRTWTARFHLYIPREGDSPTLQLIISPQIVPDAHLDVMVYAQREIYRQFRIRLAVEETTKSQTDGEAISIHDELLHAPTAHMNLQTLHEWATPPGELSIAVIGGSQAYVRGDVGADYIDQITQWFGVQAMVAGKIDNVRSAAERFRARWEGYLNEVDPDDLAQRLQQWKPAYDWTQLESLADVSHHQQWESEVRVSRELRDLAFDGHRLYETFFPDGSDLRRWVEGLTPGHRFDISWLPTSGPGWIPHVPWGLMYLPDVPSLGEPVDPLGFLALRFRLG